MTANEMTAKRRQQLIQMAEGYLDLTMVFEDRWPLDMKHRESMADRAIDCLEKVKSPMGHKPYILFLKGQAHRTAGRFSDAIRFFEQSLKIDPENTHTCLAVAWCYKRDDKLAKAIEALEFALDFEPGKAILHYNLACYWSIANDVDRAIDSLLIALDLDPKYRSFIERESDFDTIRNNPNFQSAISVAA